MNHELANEGLRRITVSMPEDVYQAFESLITARGFENRSHAVVEMIRSQSLQHIAERGDAIMAATLTLVYDESKSSLLRELSRIFRQHIAEVISSQHVLLEQEHVMEVILMQGPAQTLHEIADQLITCKGVKSAHLNLTPYLLPPLHS